MSADYSAPPHRCRMAAAMAFGATRRLDYRDLAEVLSRVDLCASGATDGLRRIVSAPTAELCGVSRGEVPRSGQTSREDRGSLLLETASL
jgi:hypothetical protein